MSAERSLSKLLILVLLDTEGEMVENCQYLGGVYSVENPGHLDILVAGGRLRRFPRSLIRHYFFNFQLRLQTLPQVFRPYADRCPGCSDF